MPCFAGNVTNCSLCCAPRQFERTSPLAPDAKGRDIAQNYSVILFYFSADPQKEPIGTQPEIYLFIQFFLTLLICLIDISPQQFVLHDLVPKHS
jgi:hypothetical protein